MILNKMPSQEQKFYEPSHHFRTSDEVRINFIDVSNNGSKDDHDDILSKDEKTNTKTILLIHGLMCSTRMWQPPHGPSEFIDSLLDQGYRVVALDCRGHGTSDKPTADNDDDSNSSRYGLRMVQDLVELLDHLKISTVSCVAGYSMGAEISIQFAITHPSRLQTLCIGGSGWSHGTDWSTKKAYESFVNRKTPMGCLCHTLRYVCCCFSSVIGPWINGDVFDMVAFFAVCEGMKEILHVSREDLESLTLPVLGISGEYDEELEYLQRIEGVVPNYRLIVIPSKNHEAALCDPMYKNNVLEFLHDSVERISD